MSWRFRKVFGRGPFRSTLSKRGIGWSVGISGFRVGVSPNGHRHVSVGIPGTGVYWHKNLDARNKVQTSSTQKAEQANASTPLPRASTLSTAEPWWKQKGLKD